MRLLQKHQHREYHLILASAAEFITGVQLS